jgi:putative transposase
MDPYNLLLMDLIDRAYLDHPFYGARKMVIVLSHQGHHVNVKRVCRLMRIMGIRAIYPKRRLSTPGESHVRYPYLLKDLPITHSDQVWCSDITYLRIGRGFVYLTAIMDWYSRYVLAWRLSNSLMADFCVDALLDALYHGQPEIFNTDQGSQYTSEEFLTPLHDRSIRISMDSRGRYFDNIMIERLWRTVKYEEIYLRDYRSIKEARSSLSRYFSFYNEGRFHQSLNYQTPKEVYDQI